MEESKNSRKTSWIILLVLLGVTVFILFVTGALDKILPGSRWSIDDIYPVSENEAVILWRKSGRWGKPNLQRVKLGEGELYETQLDGLPGYEWPQNGVEIGDYLFVPYYADERYRTTHLMRIHLPDGQADTMALPLFTGLANGEYAEPHPMVFLGKMGKWIVAKRWYVHQDVLLIDAESMEVKWRKYQHNVVAIVPEQEKIFLKDERYGSMVDWVVQGVDFGDSLLFNRQNDTSSEGLLAVVDKLRWDLKEPGFECLIGKDWRTGEVKDSLCFEASLDEVSRFRGLSKPDDLQWGELDGRIILMNPYRGGAYLVQGEDGKLGFREFDWYTEPFPDLRWIKGPGVDPQFPYAGQLTRFLPVWNRVGRDSIRMGFRDIPGGYDLLGEMFIHKDIAGYKLKPFRWDDRMYAVAGIEHNSFLIRYHATEPRIDFAYRIDNWGWQDHRFLRAHVRTGNLWMTNGRREWAVIDLAKMQPRETSHRSFEWVDVTDSLTHVFGLEGKLDSIPAKRKQGNAQVE